MQSPVIEHQNSLTKKPVENLRNVARAKIIAEARVAFAFALRILSGHNLWRHLARTRARAY